MALTRWDSLQNPVHWRSSVNATWGSMLPISSKLDRSAQAGECFFMMNLLQNSASPTGAPKISKCGILEHGIVEINIDVS